GDVALLAHHLFEQHGGSDRAALETLLQRYAGYGWPGNVRELSNLIARHVALGDVAPPRPAPTTDDPIEATLALGLSLPAARAHVVQELERRYVERVLAAHGGNVG